MKILYVAPDQPIPGTTGGSVHVAAVATGLAALGHEVHAVVAPGRTPPPRGQVRWHRLPPPWGRRQLRWALARRLARLARELQPDVVIERYYNFGGEGAWAARATGARLVLEVNAPVVDHPGSWKPWIDRVTLVAPLRRWRAWQCQMADLVVAPMAAMVPPTVPLDRLLEIEWGADVDLFQPVQASRAPFARRADETVAVFVGAFRAWHGAMNLVRAIAQLRADGRHDVRAVLVGDGPELARVRRAGERVPGLTFVGAVPHEAVPAYLAASDIGVAPFDVGAHPSLTLGFYWSPLKIFEYMAMGLPVAAPDIPRLRRIVRSDREGVLYDARDSRGLSRALARLADPALRARLGAAGRERATREYGWDRHCQTILRAIDQVTPRDWHGPRSGPSSSKGG